MNLKLLLLKRCSGYNTAFQRSTNQCHQEHFCILEATVPAHINCRIVLRKAIVTVNEFLQCVLTNWIHWSDHLSNLTKV